MSAEHTARLTRATVVLAAAVAACDTTTELTRSISFVPCGDPATFFAYQEKGGPWTPVTGDAGGFSFRLPPQRLSILYTSSNQAQTRSQAFFLSMTTDEFIEYATQPCPLLPGTKTVNGSFTGLPPGRTLAVTMGTASATVDPNAGTFSMTLVPAGALDVIATTQKPAPSGGRIADGVIVRRAVSIENNGQLAGFALGGTELSGLTNGTVTIAGLTAQDAAVVSETYYTGNRTSHPLLSDAAVNGATANARMPGVLSLPGDFYIHELSVLSTDRRRSTIRFDDVIGDRTLEVGPVLGSPSVTKLSSAPFGRAQVTLAVQPEYATFAYARLSGSAPSGGPPQHEVHLIVTVGYVGATPTTWTLAMPDLTQISGYPSQFTFSFPSTLSWEVSAHQGPLIALFGRDGMTGGTVFSSASRTGSTQIQ